MSVNFLHQCVSLCDAGPDEKTRETNHWRHIYLATVEGESQATVQVRALNPGALCHAAASRPHPCCGLASSPASKAISSARFMVEA